MGVCGADRYLSVSLCASSSQRLAIFQRDKTSLLDGVIAGRQAGSPLRLDPRAYILAVEMGDAIKLGGDCCR